MVILNVIECNLWQNHGILEAFLLFDWVRKGIIEENYIQHETSESDETTGMLGFQQRCFSIFFQFLQFF